MALSYPRIVSCLLAAGVGNGFLLAAEPSLRFEAIQLVETDFWKDISGFADLTPELSAIRSDAASWADGDTGELKSKLFTATPGAGDLFNLLLDPQPRLLEKAEWLFVGDSGRLMELVVSVRNTGDETALVNAVHLCLDEVFVRRTSRGDGILELESIDLEPKAETLTLTWPTGYFDTPRDELLERYDDGLPFPSAMGYSKTRTPLPQPIRLPAKAMTEIKIRIPTKYYPTLGFGSCHYLFRLELESEESMVSSGPIYWMGSHWWMFSDEEE